MAHRSSVEPSSECQQFRPLLISQAHEQSDDQVIYRKLRTAGVKVRRALAVYGVIGFRRSPEGRLLGPDDLVRLAGFLGCIQSTPQSSLWGVAAGDGPRAPPFPSAQTPPPIRTRSEPPGSSPSTAVLRVVREAGQTGEVFGEHWHRDGGFLEPPPQVGIFLGAEVPPLGGDTLFACQQAACAALDLRLRSTLRAARARHSQVNRRLIPQGDARAEAGPFPSNLRNVLGRHPQSGKEVIDVCEGFTEELLLSDQNSSLNGDNQNKDIGTEEEVAGTVPNEVLNELLRHCEQNEFTCRWVWRPGDLVIFDNHRTIHKATAGYQGFRREILRVLVGNLHPLQQPVLPRSGVS
ncbi:hypothetical protein CYMTET_50036 [Cymbomonas tetramitiformis]|uniref:TauD/TfdA-like domain-containing protein n=1 Tax=Cymbomonas tetramitiformis TaxID=36881 RepID=A0AAE0BP02_9CHLO|nr:hypothetical protein CYMTET_50036 [Cymbomonas tetramitiformis]